MSDRSQSTYSQDTARKNDIQTIVRTIESQEEKYAGLLPSTISFQDFKNAFLIAVQINSRLLDADRTSLWLALQRAASDGLKPDGREGALVIFGDDSEDEEGNVVASPAKGKKKVVWMPMIAGLIKLVRNTGNVVGIRAKLVYGGERVVLVDEDGKESYRHERVLGDGSNLDDSPSNIVGAYAVVNYRDGNWELEPMTRSQIDRVRAVSRSKRGPWLTWPDEMAKKTVLRRLIKRLDRASDLRRIDAAIDSDPTMEIEGVASEGETLLQDEFSQARQEQSRKVVTAAEAAFARRTQQQPNKAEQSRPVEDPKVSERTAVKEETPRENPTQNVTDTHAPDVEESGLFYPLDAITGDTITKPNGDMLVFEAPMAFAEWYANCYQDLSPEQRISLKEVNEETLLEVSKDPSIQKLLRRLHEPGLPELPASVTTGPKALVVTQLPNRRPNWGKYASEAVAEVQAVANVADLDAWIALNRPIYQNKEPLVARIDGAVDLRRKALSDPPRDKDLVQAESFVRSFATVTTSDEYHNVLNNTALITWANRVRESRPELYNQVKAADQETKARLTKPPATVPQERDPPIREDEITH